MTFRFVAFAEEGLCLSAFQRIFTIIQHVDSMRRNGAKTQ
jgi:hypothetical protein